MQDLINHPIHYTKGEIEPIDVIEDSKLNFCLGNVIKYILRAGEKKYEGKTFRQSKVIDLKKSLWYLNREIESLEREMEVEGE